MSADRSASVLARLLNRSRNTGENYNLLLSRFAIERLLYRLSVSPHAGNFVLKGALLFALWFAKRGPLTSRSDVMRTPSGSGAASAAAPARPAAARAWSPSSRMRSGASERGMPRGA